MVCRLWGVLTRYIAPGRGEGHHSPPVVRVAGRIASCTTAARPSTAEAGRAYDVCIASSPATDAVKSGGSIAVREGRVAPGAHRRLFRGVVAVRREGHLRGARHGLAHRRTVLVGPAESSLGPRNGRRVRVPEQEGMAHGRFQAGAHAVRASNARRVCARGGDRAIGFCRTWSCRADVVGVHRSKRYGNASRKRRRSRSCKSRSRRSAGMRSCTAWRPPLATFSASFAAHTRIRTSPLPHDPCRVRPKTLMGCNDGQAHGAAGVHVPRRDGN